MLAWPHTMRPADKGHRLVHSPHETGSATRFHTLGIRRSKIQEKMRTNWPKTWAGRGRKKGGVDRQGIFFPSILFLHVVVAVVDEGRIVAASLDHMQGSCQYVPFSHVTYTSVEWSILSHACTASQSPIQFSQRYSRLSCLEDNPSFSLMIITGVLSPSIPQS